jgi:Xaa-Pro aminopeptidase
MRQAHLRDAVATCDFLHWLENKVSEYGVQHVPVGAECARLT